MIEQLADIADPILLALAFGAFLAGLIDAVVGGGGLLQIPLLFTAFPEHPPAPLFGTNKLASIVGTSSAAIQYARRITIEWSIALPSILAALLFSWLGARSVTLFPPDILRPLVLVMLIAVAIYTFRRKEFGLHSSNLRPTGIRPRLSAYAIGATLGFYDGFFGPGTGSFLIFAFIRFLGMDFLRASVTAKLTNVATNLAALAFFAINGAIIWEAALTMAVANLTGAMAGSHLALKHGSHFIRRVFLLVVCALIAKLCWDLLQH
ncbi:MAG: TSUP family transporter [Zoogloeaceae bacterium]|nr:TSUP family transporter [Rhodocyclaceae bacterium]MCP5237103.1 TSUP family transporter [Zoogloeaceae bacterium]